MKRTLIFISCGALVALTLLGGYFIYFNFRYPLLYKDVIKKYSKMYGVEPELVSAVIYTESSFNPNAKSSAGAVGLMQLLPETAVFVSKLLGEDKILCEKDLYDVENNIKYGTKYISYLRNKFQDNYTLLCAYNAGEGRARKWLKLSEFSNEGKTLKYCPYKETSAYASKVILISNYYKKKF